MRWMAGAILALALAGCAREIPTDPGAAAPAPAPPQSASVLRKAMAQAIDGGDRIALTRAALDLAMMGGSLSDASFDRIAPLLDADVLIYARPVWIANRQGTVIDALRKRFRDNAAADPGWGSSVFAEVPAEYRLVEGIAWDEAGQRLFVATVVDGRLAYMAADRSWHEVPIGSPRGGLFGIAIDRAHGLLWLTTGSVEQTAVAGERMTGLIAVDLRSLAVVRRVPVAPGTAGFPGDLAIARDGTVYASNPVSGAVHRCPPGCAVLESWLPDGSWRSPQGLVIDDRRGLLYVADYPSGLWRVDLGSRGVSPARVNGPQMLDGIDGLVMLDDGNFGAVQNGTRPLQVAKLYVEPIYRHPRDPAISSVPRLLVVEGQGEPTLATRRGSSMLFVADGQWERYGPGGTITDGAPPRPTPIRSIDMSDLVITAR